MNIVIIILMVILIFFLFSDKNIHRFYLFLHNRQIKKDFKNNKQRNKEQIEVFKKSRDHNKSSDTEEK